MNSVLDIRIQNLKWLSAQWGGPTSLAKKLKLSGGSYICQLMAGTRPVTEKTARKFEAQLGLATGWLDQDHGGGTVRAVALDDALLARTITLVSATMNESGVTLPPEKLAEVVSWVYDDASKSGQLNEALVRRVVGLLK